ncbi:hypothetical protein Nham_0296 [Nitrobacter hamburgensis X14]|uniref:Uncharacterized protein n=1 Tax=Nitrobacter hamburgensis (strain DSM 10229 / NCIMB 13809 / X14) TaxID=323097 RepID=Q1QRF5_NITHX|nr:hypothetical protein [Nitrobacter hamburgensis]ABE61192.1 hypothetical protein Nham_0296 [Nitrobacter hamburgensis X14]
MRVSIACIEKSRVLFFPVAPRTRVSVRLILERDEDIIIRHYGFQSHVLVSRKPTVVIDEREEADGRGHVRVAKDKREIDNNIRLRAFMGKDAEWQFPHPSAANAFIAELRQGFLKFKEFLVANGAPAQGDIFDV